jgi:hypothetical protein
MNEQATIEWALQQGVDGRLAEAMQHMLALGPSARRQLAACVLGAQVLLDAPNARALADVLAECHALLGADVLRWAREREYDWR